MYGRRAHRRVYELRFRTPQALARAFGDVLGCETIEDCWVDEDRGVLRFRSDPVSAARLVHRAESESDLVGTTSTTLRPL
jgi:hypothetical protein